MAMLVAAWVLVATPSAQAAAIIDNGVVQLGVDDLGDLNAAGGEPSAQTGTTSVGLRYMPHNLESTSPGCDCEGWGASYNNAIGAGTANAGGSSLESVTNPTYAVTPETVSFVNDDETAVVVVDVMDLRVRHDYHPAPMTPFAYEAEVTLENIGEQAMTDVRYRRVMDWDIEPSAYREFVTIWADDDPRSLLNYSTTDGFHDTNPLSGRSSNGREGPPREPGFVDEGPVDHGALFDFAFGDLEPGGSRTFWIYYGATPTEATALEVLDEIGAEVYSLGQSEDGAITGEPATFLFAFTGVIDRPPEAAFGWSPADPYANGNVTFVDLSRALGTSTIVHSSWDFDGDIIEADPWTRLVPYRFEHAGTYEVKLTVTDDQGRKGSTMRDVVVRQPQPPSAMFDWMPRMADRLGDVTFRDQSTDEDGTIEHRAWDIDGRAAEGAVVHHRFEELGRFPVQLTVTDSQGLQATHQAWIHVRNLAPQATIEVTGALLTGESVTFEASASDPDGSIADLQWTIDGQATHGRTTHHVFDHGGNFNIVLVATDAEGLSTRVVKGIRIDNRPPDAAFTAPTEALSTHTDVHFWDTSSDADGHVRGWLWRFGDGSEATDRHPRHQYQQTGAFQVQLTVTDDQGATSTPAHAWVSVQNHAPVARATTSVEGGVVTVDDLSYDPDGTIAQTRWMLDGQDVNPTWPWRLPLPESPQRLTLVVQDNDGAQRVQQLLIGDVPDLEEPSPPGSSDPAADPIPQDERELDNTSSTERPDVTSFDDGEANQDAGPRPFPWYILIVAFLAAAIAGTVTASRQRNSGS